MNKEKMKSKVNKTDTKDIWGKKKKNLENLNYIKPNI